MNRFELCRATCAVGLLLPAFVAQSAILSSRSELDALLGANQVFEDFESPQITAQKRHEGSPVDSTTVVSGLGGPGLVEPGITFRRNPDYVGSGVRPIDWNPAGYFGSVSQTMFGAGGCCAASIRNDFQILFTVPVTAFGMDLVAYSGFSSQGVITVYDGNGNPLGDTAVTGSVGVGTFFGWANAGGISKVFIHDNPNQNYISLDNIGFGAAVPVPGSVWLLGSAIAGMGAFVRRKASQAA